MVSSSVKCLCGLLDCSFTSRHLLTVWAFWEIPFLPLTASPRNKTLGWFEVFIHIPVLTDTQDLSLSVLVELMVMTMMLKACMWVRKLLFCCVYRSSEPTAFTYVFFSFLPWAWHITKNITMDAKCKLKYSLLIIKCLQRYVSQRQFGSNLEWGTHHLIRPTRQFWLFRWRQINNTVVIICLSDQQIAAQMLKCNFFPNQ